MYREFLQKIISGKWGFQVSELELLMLEINNIENTAKDLKKFFQTKRHAYT